MGGLLLNLVGISIPVFINSTLEILAQPALACGTLIAGAALQFTFRKRDLLDVTIASVLKLIVLLLLAISNAIPLGVSAAALTSIVLICAVPAAPSAYILAARMGGDTRLIATITGVQTLLAAATMPLMLAVAANWPT